MAWENFKLHALGVLEDWHVGKTHKEGMRHKHKNCTYKPRRKLPLLRHTI